MTGNSFNMIHSICIVLSGQILLITPSLMCSFTLNYHINFLRPAPIWPCSSVGRATVICQCRQYSRVSVNTEHEVANIFDLFFVYRKYFASCKCNCNESYNLDKTAVGIPVSAR